MTLHGVTQRAVDLHWNVWVRIYFTLCMPHAMTSGVRGVQMISLRYLSRGGGGIWLRHSGAGRKVSLEFLNWHNPSGSTMALGSSQPVTNEYHEYFLVDKDGRCVQLTTLSPPRADCHENWELQPPGTLRACSGIALPSTWFDWPSAVVCQYLPVSGVFS